MTRRQSLVAAAALLAAIAVAPAAHADASDFMYGGCGFDSVVPSTGDTYSGWIEDRSVTTTGYGNPHLIGAAVTCWMAVNGVRVPGSTHTYGDIPGVPGVQAGSDPLTFTVGPDDFPVVCQQVRYVDGTTGWEDCLWQDLQLPSQHQALLRDHLLATASGLSEDIDPAVCPALAAAAGSYPGGVTIDPTGDTTVPDPLELWEGPVYDCPPYVNGS